MLKITFIVFCSLILMVKSEDKFNYSCGIGKISGNQIDTIENALVKVYIHFRKRELIESSYLNNDFTAYAKVTCSSVEKAFCKNCIARLEKKIWDACKYAQDAKIWNEMCTVQYSNHEID